MYNERKVAGCCFLPFLKEWRLSKKVKWDSSYFWSCNLYLLAFCDYIRTHVYPWRFLPYFASNLCCGMSIPFQWPHLRVKLSLALISSATECPSSLKSRYNISDCRYIPVHTLYIIWSRKKVIGYCGVTYIVPYAVMASLEVVVENC